MNDVEHDDSCDSLWHRVEMKRHAEFTECRNERNRCRFMFASRAWHRWHRRAVRTFGQLRSRTASSRDRPERPRQDSDAASPASAHLDIARSHVRLMLTAGFRRSRQRSRSAVAAVVSAPTSIAMNTCDSAVPSAGARPGSGASRARRRALPPSCRARSTAPFPSRSQSAAAASTVRSPPHRASARPPNRSRPAPAAARRARGSRPARRCENCDERHVDDDVAAAGGTARTIGLLPIRGSAAPRRQVRQRVGPAQPDHAGVGGLPAVAAARASSDWCWPARRSRCRATACRARSPSPCCDARSGCPTPRRPSQQFDRAGGRCALGPRVHVDDAGADHLQQPWKRFRPCE